VYKKHAQPVLKKWGWGALSQYSLSNFHWWDVKRRNLWIRKGKPILIDEWVIKYKK
jgi:hypothetical protein